MHVDSPQSACRFGVARGDVTPPVGIYHRMWGAAAHDRATGVHRPLTATAIVLAAADGELSPQTEQVVLALDHCLLWDGEMRALERAVCDGGGIAAEQLVVAFSHTHAAGLMGWERESLPGGELIRPYLEDIGRRCGELVAEARAKLAPATLVYGTGTCTLAGQRDLWDDAGGQFVCGFNPDAPADDTVLVARVTGSGGDTLATVVNYACHPTTLAWDNTLISPDYPGAMREVIEAATGAPCVFLQGASGDLGPREGFVGDTAVADRNGRQLGYAALAALEALPPPATRFAYAGPVVSGATIGTWKHVPCEAAQLQRHADWRAQRFTVSMPHRPGLASADEVRAERASWQQQEAEARAAGDEGRAGDCRAMVERMDRKLVRLAGLSGEAFDYPVALWKAGDAVWVAVEGEPYNLLQTQLRRRFHGVPIIVMALAGGSRCSYLPPQQLYGRGIYQESVAILAPGCLERLIEAASEQIAALLGNE